MKNKLRDVNAATIAALKEKRASYLAAGLDVTAIDAKLKAIGAADSTAAAPMETKTETGAPDKAVPPKPEPAKAAPKPDPAPAAPAKSAAKAAAKAAPAQPPAGKADAPAAGQTEGNTAPAGKSD